MSNCKNQTRGFNEWFDGEQQGWSINRRERVINEFGEKINIDRLEEWLKAAYEQGLYEGTTK